MIPPPFRTTIRGELMLGTTSNKLVTFTFSEIDKQLVESHYWALHKTGYIHTSGKYLHRLIMPARAGYVVDHINRNKLDNRRENLRYATVSENRHNSKLNVNNTSGVKGVSRTKKGAPWAAEVMVNRKRFYLGAYSTIEEAANARSSFLEKKELP